jgi:hypothetical protein
MADKEKTEDKPLETLDEIKEEVTEEVTEEGGGEPTPKPAPAKKRRKRRKKPTEPEPEVQMDDKETSFMLVWLFDVIADRAGEHWKLTKEEADTGAVLVNKVVIKHMPAIAKYSEEIALGMWGMAILMPRLRVKVEKQRQEIPPES